MALHYFCGTAAGEIHCWISSVSHVFTGNTHPQYQLQLCVGGCVSVLRVCLSIVQNDSQSIKLNVYN